MAVQIQFRRDAAANWTSANPTMASGELGYETDTNKFKIGDGTTAWASLSYFEGGGSMSAAEILTAIKTVDGSGSGLDADTLDGHDTSYFVAANGAVSGATKTKITYDAKGLVTGSADATTADIADSTDKRYCTDAQKTVISNTSGTNTGDETESAIKTKLGITTLSGSNTGDQTDITGNAATVTGLSVTAGKTLTVSNSVTLTATDDSTLAIGTGGTLGTAAYTDTTAYATAAQGTTADGAVPKSLFDANTMLYATTDNTPAALSVGASTIVGRKASGDISAMSASEARSVLNVADGANAYVHPNHSGDVTSVGDGAQTIASGAVTLAKMANMATASLIYRKTAGDGAPEVNSLDTLKTDLGIPELSANFQSTAENESAALGAELASAEGWTLGTGWSGDFTTGFIHTTGNTGTLTRTMTGTGTNLYQVEFHVDSASGLAGPSTDFTVTLGNSNSFVVYKGGGDFDYAFGIKSVSDGDFVVTPGTTFDGTISGISVKRITASAPPAASIKDSTGANSYEARPTVNSLGNLYLGYRAGGYNTKGDGNVGIGYETMSMNTTGYWNLAAGYQAMQNNTVGSRCVALGKWALQDNISGDRNVAIGTYALQHNTHGRQNLAIGADTLWKNITGSQNTAMGMAVLPENTTGIGNVSLGYASMSANVNGSYNVAIGMNALNSSVSVDGSIAIGREALKNTTAANNVAIGYGSQSINTTGANNVSIGYSSLQKNTTGGNNVVIGHCAGQGGSNGVFEDNTLIGYRAGVALTDGGRRNTFIGCFAGDTTTKGYNNICIGRYAETPAAATNNHLNIGNTIYGDINTKRIGINVVAPTAKLHLPAGAAAANSAPLKIEAGTLLGTPEAGAIEYDGTNLYITQSDGTRKTLAFVA